MALAIVLAVYMPPQEPGPGMAQLSIFCRPLSVSLSLACAPTASNTDTISSLRVSPVMQPGKMVPPYTKTLGRFMRAMAITQAGMFLSQPPIATKPSMHSQPTTVSMESAITSRLTSEYFMPSVPMEMPSEIVMVLKIIALPPALLAPRSASCASRSMCILHGVTLLQVDATPTIGLPKSPVLKPVG